MTEKFPLTIHQTDTISLAPIILCKAFMYLQSNMPS